MREKDIPVCGGTTRSYDKDAPTAITCDTMTYFSAASALSHRKDDGLSYVSAFAAPAGEDSFLYLELGYERSLRSGAWALVKGDVFPRLVSLVRALDLAKNNGRHSQTHGLPENFGGAVSVAYASGEKISFSDNQSPVLTDRAGEAIGELFTSLMAGERVPLPEPESLKSIFFEEIRPSGGFCRANLTLFPDGTGLNERSARYDDGPVYERQKAVSASNVAIILKNIRDTGLFAWENLPDSPFRFGGEKRITFTLEGGRQITVRDGRLVPQELRNGFFNIELELVTRN